MASMRYFFDSAGGKALAAVVLLLAAAAVYFSVRANFGQSTAGALSRDRTFICSETNKPFQHTLKIGDQLPIKSPHTGRNTGYPAELCYWTKDGQIKSDPTPVLLRSHVGDRSPTFCPDCNRLVVGHNPRPNPGDNPPPTKEQHKPRGTNRDRE